MKGYEMKKIISGIILCLLLTVVLGYVYSKRRKGPEFKTDTIIRGEIKSICTATGTVNPLKTVLVGTQVSGRIKEIYVDYNSTVKAGQLIAVIDPSTFEAQMEQARANLISARANVSKAEASLLDAKRNLERTRNLFKNNIVGKSELDTVETNYEVAKSQLNVAKAQVVQTEAAYSFSETNMKYTKIYSPVDGIVISRNVDTGQTVAASFQTPTLFTIAQDLRKMQINTNVDEADIGQVRVGQDTDFTVDAYPNITFTGKVVQIRNSPIVVQNVVTYDVVITVENQELKLKPGMTANVTIIISVKKDILKIPNAALRFKPENSKQANPDPQKQCVWILENRELECIEIETGINDYKHTELILGDLVEGQEVVVGSLNKKSK